MRGIPLATPFPWLSVLCYGSSRDFLQGGIALQMNKVT